MPVFAVVVDGLRLKSGNVLRATSVRVCRMENDILDALEDLW